MLLAGETGSGKSMLLNAIAGLGGLYPEPRAAGSLMVRFPDDSPVGKTPSPTASQKESDPLLPQPRPGRIALVSQSPRDGLVSLDVLAALALPLEEQGVAPQETVRRVEEALAHMDLLSLADQDVSTLSSGEARRVALAGARAQRASLLLLDEPFADLDPAGVRLLRDDLARLVGSVTLMVAEHRIHLAGDLVHATLHLVPHATSGRGVNPKGWPVPGDRQTHPRQRPPGVRAHRLGIRRGGKQLLEEAELELGPGVWGLMGANGTGKSSLLLTLAGLLPPRRGRVHVDGIPVYNGARRVRPHGRLERRLRTSLQVTFQQPREAFFAATTTEELAAPLQSLFGRSKQEAKRSAQDALDHAQVAALGECSPQRLSGGQARFAQLMGALLVGPRVLFLDEPTHGLDPGLRAHLTELLRALGEQGNVVVVAIHEPEVLPRGTDWLFLPGDGSLLQGEEAAPGATRPREAGFATTKQDPRREPHSKGGVVRP